MSDSWRSWKERALTLLLLVAVVLGDSRLKQLPRLVVFGHDNDSRFLGLRSHKSAWTEFERGEDVRLLLRPCRSLCLDQTSHCS